MLRTTCQTTQHHNPADWNIFYTRFLLAENIKDPMLGTWLCAVWQARMSGGKELPPSAWPTLTTHPSTLYPTLFQPYYRYCLMLALFLLWYLYICLQNSNTVCGFTCLCTQYWDTFIINTCPCIFSSPLWITLLHFQMHPLSMHNLYFSLSASCWSTETSWDL